MSDRDLIMGGSIVAVCAIAGAFINSGAGAVVGAFCGLLIVSLLDG